MGLYLLKYISEFVSNTLLFHTFLYLKYFFLKGDCWICMELMDISLDKFYRFTHQRLQQKIPESILGKIALAVSLTFVVNNSVITIFGLTSYLTIPFIQILDRSGVELFERKLGNYSSRCKTLQYLNGSAW